MLPVELERYLHERIPLSRAMAVSVLAVGQEAVTLQVPLAPNINHRDTVFGGSASALAILASWALLHVRLQAEGIAGRLVIQRNTMEYQRPIRGLFTARSTLEHPADWQRFTATLARKGKSRIKVVSLLAHTEQAVGRFTGEFVAFAEAAGDGDSGGG